MSFTITGKTAQELYGLLDERYTNESDHFQTQAVAVDTLRATLSSANRNLKSTSSTATTKIDTAAETALSTLKKQHNQHRNMFLALKSTAEAAKTFKKELDEGIQKFNTISISEPELQTLEFFNPKLRKETEDLNAMAKKNLETLKGYFVNMNNICQQFEDRLPVALKDLISFNYYVTSKDNSFNGTSSGILSGISYYVSTALPEPFVVKGETETSTSLSSTPPSASAPISLSSTPVSTSSSSSSSSSSTTSKKVASLKPSGIPPVPKALTGMKEPTEKIA